MDALLLHVLFIVIFIIVTLFQSFLEIRDRKGLLRHPAARTRCGSGMIIVHPVWDAPSSKAPTTSSMMAWAWEPQLSQHLPYSNCICKVWEVSNLSMGSAPWVSRCLAGEQCGDVGCFRGRRNIWGLCFGRIWLSVKLCVWLNFPHQNWFWVIPLFSVEEDLVGSLQSF